MKHKLLSLLLLCSYTLRAMESENSQEPVTFYQDQALYEKLREQLDASAEKLLEGQYANICTFNEAKGQVALALQSILPCLTIEGTQEDVPNEEKNKNYVKKLERKTEVSQFYDPVKSFGIKKVSAAIDEENGNEIKIKYLKKQDGAFGESVVVYTLPDGLQATCLAMSQLAWSIYIGDAQGNIYEYDPIARKEKQILKHHKNAIQALAFFNLGSYIASKDDKRTYVWHISDTRPRLALKDEPHRTTYLYDQAIVRSHVGQGMFGSMMRNADQVYKLPGCWLNPMLFSADNAKLAFLYLVYKIYFNLDVHPSETLSRLYRAPVLETFEPGVAAAFRHFIEAKSKIGLPNKFNIQQF